MLKTREKSFSMKHDYDFQSDSIFLYITKRHEYQRSLRLDEDIILDFDKNNIPVAMEILHASKRFNIDKTHLRNPMGLDMNIEVAKDYIHIKAAFTLFIRNKHTPLEFNAEGENSINLPVTETHFAAAAI
jgi:uncharacterized protein YuzE